MAALTLAFSATQSGDGTTVTIEDLSNWGAGNNDSNYTESQFTREFILTDALGDPIVTIPAPAGTNDVEYNVPAGSNPWVNIEFSAVGPVTLEITQKYPFKRNFELAYINVVKQACGCCGNKFSYMDEVDALQYGAELAAPVGDAVNYQNFIDGAYKLVTA